MDEITTMLVKECALKNNEFRVNLPINFITHEIVAFRYEYPKDYLWPKNVKYKYDHFNGSLILSNRMFVCNDIYKVLQDLTNYDEFTEENDPFKEKRFGDLCYSQLSFNDNDNVKDCVVFWKIEFFTDNTMEFKATNYLKDNCYRVLTVYEMSEAK